VDVTAVGGLRFGTITAIPAGGRQGQQFAVAQDQQLDGTVVSIDHESVVIQVGNQRMRATTDASVRPGDVLRLLVRATGPDQVLMQIVGRGGATQVQTRSLTRQDLATELTQLGVAPDEESLQVAGELLARGQPLTAANVLEVRGALARAAHARSPLAQEEPGVNQADLRAAVFLKAQGLPVTKAAVEIVRQAWSSGSALGQEVEQLRDSLATLATRLTGLVDAGEPDSVDARLVKAQGEPSVRAGSAWAAPADEGGAQQSPPTRQGPRGPSTGAVPGQIPVQLTEGEPTTSRARAGPTGNEGESQPRAAAPRQPAPAASQPQPTTEGPERSSPTLSAPSPPTTQSPSLSRPSAPVARPPSSSPVTTPTTPPPEDAPPAAASTSAGTQSPASPSAPSATAAASAGMPPLGRLLAAVTESLAHLQLVDDEAVAGSRAELAARIRQVVAEQGTPVEAKLARVLEGLAERPTQIDRALVADLRTALADLTTEVSRQLDQPDAARRLPPEARSALETVRSHAESVLGRVELQQMTNASAAAAPTPTPDASYLMFQLPIPGRQEGQTAQIRIQQQEGGGMKRIDPNNVHVVFQFEMQHLGTVRVDLRLLERRVSCQMGSTDPTATALLDQHAGELREGLGELGYVVDALRCAQLTPEDLRAPDVPASPAAASSGPALRVDARA
jgi:hypothetical protein